MMMMMMIVSQLSLLEALSSSKIDAKNGVHFQAGKQINRNIIGFEFEFIHVSFRLNTMRAPKWALSKRRF